MSESPIISSLLSVPTLAVNGRSQLTVGIQLSDGQRFWGDCVDAPAASRLDETAVFDPTQAQAHLQNLIWPLWQDQPVTEFRPLAQQLLTVTEPFTYLKTIPPKPEPATGAVTRRGLITGFMAEEEEAVPQQKKVTVERPLHPALQYGLTAALLQAVASLNRVSVLAQVVWEYGLDLLETAVPLQIPLDDQTIQLAQSILPTHVASFGYTTSKSNHKSTLGPNGERLQQHIRQIGAWLRGLSFDSQPTIHLDLQGGLGALFDNNSGKILGALYGLEQAAKPDKLFIRNPVWLSSREKQQQQLKQLASFLRMRRMATQLVADAWVDSLADVELFADAHVCQMLYLSLPRLGNLEVGITAVLHAHRQNLPILLSGTDKPLTTHIALATRPALLSGSPLLHYNEMQKVLQP